MDKYNVLLVEDDAFTRKLLQIDLQSLPEINLLACLENGEEAVRYIQKNTPDLVLMDINMPVMNGIEATKNIKQFNTNIKILMLTSHQDKETVLDAFKANANGYCVKNIKKDELMQVIKTVMTGGIWFDKAIASFIYTVFENIQNQNPEKEESKNAEDYNITPRERNILKLISDGCTNVQIAEKLIISRNTVKIHVASIMKKLNVNDRTKLAIFTLKNDII